MPKLNRESMFACLEGCIHPVGESRQKHSESHSISDQLAHTLHYGTKMLPMFCQAHSSSRQHEDIFIKNLKMSHKRFDPQRTIPEHTENQLKTHARQLKRKPEDGGHELLPEILTGQPRRYSCLCFVDANAVHVHSQMVADPAVVLISFAAQLGLLVLHVSHACPFCRNGDTASGESGAGFQKADTVAWTCCIPC